MKRTTLWWIAVGVFVGSLLLTLVGWFYFRQPWFFLALFLPFVFPLWRRAGPPPGRSCPVCGFATDDPRDVFCPRDGTPLNDSVARRDQ